MYFSEVFAKTNHEINKTVVIFNKSEKIRIFESKFLLFKRIVLSTATHASEI